VKQPRIIVFERDSKLAERLAPLANSRRWVVREPRQIDACIRLIDDCRPSVLVIRLTPVDRAVELLSQLTEPRPGVAIVVVGDEAPPVLAGLAWDLGVDFALFPPLTLDVLPGIVERLMGGPT
jgi:DNA-binding NtrC family response regulator